MMSNGGGFDSARYFRFGFGAGNDGDRYWAICLGANKTRVEFSDRYWEIAPTSAGLRVRFRIYSWDKVF